MACFLSDIPQKVPASFFPVTSVTHAFHSKIQETETEGLREFKGKLGYTAKSCLKGLSRDDSEKAAEEGGGVTKIKDKGKNCTKTYYYNLTEKCNLLKFEWSQHAQVDNVTL